MGISPIPPSNNDGRSAGKKDNLVRKTARLMRQSKRRRKQLKLEAKADIREAKQTLSSNVRSASWWYSVGKLSTVTAFYFCSSVALTFYQKDLIKTIPFPLSMVILHMMIKYLLASFCRIMYSKFCAHRCSKESISRNRRNQPNPDTRVVLSWSDYLKKVSPVAAAAGFDIGLSQWSLKFVTVALYTMTKTTCILFIMAFGLIFKLEKKHWSQIVIVGSIGLGIGLFTHKSTSFSTVGFAIALTSSLMCGLRWTLSQMVMQKSSLGLENPIDMIYHIQPLMIVALLPLAVAIEGVNLSASMHGFRFEAFGQFVHTLLMVSFGGVLAFFMELAEYLIVLIGSSLTLAIIGVTKEIVTVSVSLKRNHTELSVLNSVGMVICLIGILAHVIRKAIVIKKEKKTQGNNIELGDFQLSSSSEDEFRGIASNRKKTAKVDTVSSIPLLLTDDEWSSDGEEDGISVRQKKAEKWTAVTDDFFLTENRTWTSVKDSHLQSATNNLDNSAPLSSD